nr:hypothetical protein [Tanacetum cinerariifolium]
SQRVAKRFTATAYPNIQENLKLPVHEPVIPEEPISSTGTLSSLQQLTREFSFGDQFINDKPTEADNEKTTTETEVESLVSVTIQQDTSPIPPMTSPEINITATSDSPTVQATIPISAPATEATTTTMSTTLPIPSPQQPSMIESRTIKRIGELELLIKGMVERNA